MGENAAGKRAAPRRPRRVARRLSAVGLLALVGLAAWLVFGRERPEPPATGPLVGKLAPEIADEVEQWLNCEEVDLADLAGQAVLLYFWHPRDGASPATLDHVQGIAARYAADGLVTIGLCVCDAPSEVQPLIAEHGLTFRVALDSDADVHLRAYRIGETGTPYCYLVGTGGKIAWEGLPEKLTARRIRKLLPSRR